ncbi:hypothetical protein J3R30DRAFT_1368098 [Lentinula aciculospora]|uniref:Uncharacterized protein n=1 Tax=Lentinula aciculospora TaxID=153920 RepID=A0A9W9ANJ4_9AGAR|nr:hypothetical protein J3R30DRAFT_1368098 [Lentinula aciculospora]
MYQQSNLSLISITSDELRWLDADTILQESSTTDLININPILSNTTGSHSSSSRSSTTINTSTYPRHKNNKRHHYQRSTKSSSAKAVNRMSGSFNRRHSRSNLNFLVTPPVSTSSSYAQTSSPESPTLATTASFPIKTPPRLNKRTASYSSTHGGSPGSEWIYRRPKSPSTSSPPRHSAIKYARRTVSDTTASASTPSPASTADSSRCATPTSTTYRSGLAASYFPDVSTSCLNASSSNLPAHLVNGNRDANVNNGSGSSIGSIGSIGVLIPSTLGLNSSASSLSRQPSSSKPKALSTGQSKTGTFWTSILHPRSGPISNLGNPSTPNSTSGSRIARLSLGRAKSKSLQLQPSSPLAVHAATTIPSIWSGADLNGANGTSPKRRKGRGSLKELGISRIPVSSRITGNRSPTSPTFSSPPIYNIPVKRRTSYVRSGSFSSTTSSTTSSAAYANSVSSLSSTPSSPLTPSTPVSPTVGGFGKTKKFQPKFEPHHRVIVEVVEDDDSIHMDSQRRKSPSPTKSILASRMPYSEVSPELTSSSSKFDSGLDLSLDASLQRSNKRKDSVSTTVSSNKSVKFVEQPTVHYASAIYESWDGTTGAGPFEYNNMGIDLSEMDMGTNEDTGDNEDGRLSEETAEQNSYIHSHPYAARDLNLAGDTAAAAADEATVITNTRFVEDFHNIRPTTSNARALRAQEREDTCVTPTPDRGRERTSSGSTGTGTLRSFVSLKRKGSSASSTTSSAIKRSLSTSSPETRLTTPRRTISGPYALGTTMPSYPHPLHSEASEHPVASLKSVTEDNEKRHDMGLRNAGLRSAPSLESFKSVKSGKSMRSLKSLPDSVKSSISLRAKGMRDWFKGRVTVSAM